MEFDPVVTAAIIGAGAATFATLFTWGTSLGRDRAYSRLSQLLEMRSKLAGDLPEAVRSNIDREIVRQSAGLTTERKPLVYADGGTLGWHVFYRWQRGILPRYAFVLAAAVVSAWFYNTDRSNVGRIILIAGLSTGLGYGAIVTRNFLRDRRVARVDASIENIQLANIQLAALSVTEQEEAGTTDGEVSASSP